MAFLTKDQVKPVVVDSLKVVADVPDNVEASTFANFTSDDSHIFLTVLKSKLNALPYIMDNGTTTHTAYYDVDLTPDSINSWPTVLDCINWIVDNQNVVYLN